MEEYELIAFWHSCTWIHRFFFYEWGIWEDPPSKSERGIHSFEFAFKAPHFCNGCLLKMWIASGSTSHIHSVVVLTSHLSVFLATVDYIFSEAFNQQYSALFLSFISRLQFSFLWFFFSPYRITAAPHLQVGLVSVWYLSHILLLLQHGHRLGTARSETSTTR